MKKTPTWKVRTLAGATVKATPVQLLATFDASKGWKVGQILLVTVGDRVWTLSLGGTFGGEHRKPPAWLVTAARTRKK